MGNPVSLTDVVDTSDFFSSAWYSQKYPDVALSDLGSAEHYLRVGARLGRDPGPLFDSRAYLKTYLDVAARGENPLVHFEMHGQNEGRRPKPKTHARKDGQIMVDVVVPVYNALEDVKACLTSLGRCENGFSQRILVINDGSDAATTKWLRDACTKLNTKTTRFKLIEHTANKGYTVAVNTGLKASNAPYVVTLNSDTIVTPYWLDGLVNCIESAPEIGIVGPLSNAASWQNVPELYNKEGQFAINALPDGMSPDRMAKIVRRASNRAYPRSPFVNGFCFMISRDVIDAVGYMDEGAFPTGYGEENDFCIRAGDAGFALAFADDTYVFHAKSKSFGTGRRIELSKAGGQAIREKHGLEKFATLLEKVKQTDVMDAVRGSIHRHLRAEDQPQTVQNAPDWVMSQKILFLLPVRGGGGGAHSVVQEVAAMRQMGVEAKIAVLDANYFDFVTLYGDIPDVHDLFVGFRDETVVATAQEYDVVVATIFTSVRLLERVTQNCPWILPAYYAQDYEPMFFEPDTERWAEAIDSYTLIPDALIFAKTHWIGQEIEKHHKVRVHKVEPSIDYEVYYPPTEPRQEGRKFCITAMIRPSTPRRGAGRTMDLLCRLKEQHGDMIEVKIFGCNKETDEYQALPRGFDFTNLGILTRPQVADLLREADVFIDLSDYQAFGRTGLEAMACGTLAMVPKAGGGDEYAVDGDNALVVDTFDVDTCFDRLTQILDQPEKMAAMQMAAMRTASAYSPHRAAISELLIFASAIVERRTTHPTIARPKIILIPTLTDGAGTITGSAYVRLLCPYRQDALARDWNTSVHVETSLPTPGSADLAIIQRDLRDAARGLFANWHKAWRQEGGRLIYEIDDDLLDGNALKSRGYKEDVGQLAERVHAYADAADVITVSTERLVGVFSDHAEKIRLVPNFIDERLWFNPDFLPEPQDNKARVTIGYAGTPTHTEDLMLVNKAITTLENNYGVEVEVVGAFQRIKPLFGQRISLPNNSVYPVFSAWLKNIADWDITIIPLADNSFNQAKSNLKFLESAALNTAIVCSDTPEYRRVARHEENCLMVENTTEAWLDALTRLIEDVALRQRLAEQACRDVSEQLTVQKNTNLYISILQQALQG